MTRVSSCRETNSKMQKDEQRDIVVVFWMMMLIVKVTEVARRSREKERWCRLWRLRQSRGTIERSQDDVDHEGYGSRAMQSRERGTMTIINVMTVARRSREGFVQPGFRQWEGRWVSFVQLRRYFWLLEGFIRQKLKKGAKRKLGGISPPPPFFFSIPHFKWDILQSY